MVLALTEEETHFKKLSTSVEGRYLKHKLVTLEVGHVVYIDESIELVRRVSQDGWCLRRDFNIEHTNIGFWRRSNRLVRVKRLS
jgi:hypothetical protein